MAKLKKWLSALLALALVLTQLSLPAFAAESDVSTAVEKDGDTVTLTLTAETKMSFGGIAGFVKYDNDAFTLVSIAADRDFDRSPYVNLETGKFTCDSPEYTAEAGTVLLTVTFTANDSYVKGAEYAFSFDIDEAYDPDFEDYDWGTQSATLVEEEEQPTGTVTTAVAKEGDTVTLTLTADTEMTFGGITGLIAYDTDAFTLVSVEANDGLDGGVNLNTGNFTFDSEEFTAAAGAVLITATFTVTDAYEKGAEYVFSFELDEAYNKNFAEYDWGEQTATLVEEPTEPEFKVQSLVLSGLIGVNFYMNLPELEGVDYTESYMTFEITGKGTTTERDDYDAADLSSNGKYYGFTCYVNSIQMADTITATFHYGDDKTVEKTYSVMQYVQDYDEKVADGTLADNAEATALVHAIADYGHYAQPFLSAANKWTIGTDYAEMTTHYAESFDLDAIKSAVADKEIVKDVDGSQITKVTHRLFLDSDTTLEVYLTAADGVEVTASATYNGQTYTAEKQSDGRYLIQISGLSAHRLGDMITINGTAGGDFTVKVSTMSYVYAVLNSSAFNADAKNAVAALYQYYAAVMAYRGN